MSKFNIIKSIKFAVLLVLSTNVFLIPSSYASVRVDFTGTMRGNPPCDVTGADVDFGEVGVTKIDGINYTQDFSISVECPADTGALYIAYSGLTANTFDDKALQTSVAGLGIRLYRNGTVIAPDNHDIPLIMPAEGGIVPIALSAAPVRDMSPSYLLLEGEFRATGTIEVRYP